MVVELGEPLREGNRWNQTITHGVMYSYISWDVSEQVGVYLCVEGIVTDSISNYIEMSLWEKLLTYEWKYPGKNLVDKIIDFVRMRLQR